jgi:uncharacterized damage-inducible protein DinB
MTIKDIDDVYNYSDWANQRLTKVIEGLAPEEFTGRVGGSFESIRNALVHMLSAEWGWLARCGGPERGPRLEPRDFPTLAAIEETWGNVQRGRREFLSSLKDDDVLRMITFYNDDGEARSLPLGEIMQHAANHNAHHRGQVSMMLRILGHTPGDVDQLFYHGERRGVPVW